MFAVGASLERLKASPPAAVIWPGRAFDDIPDRAVGKTAPRISAWVKTNYTRSQAKQHRWFVMFPNDEGLGDGLEGGGPQSEGTAPVTANGSSATLE